MNPFYKSYCELIETYLGNRIGISKALPILTRYPEVTDIHIGELRAAIRLINRYANSENLFRNKDLFANTEYLTSVLAKQLLPTWDGLSWMVVNQNESEKEELTKIFLEMSQFSYPDMDFTPSQTIATTIISFYRTHSLNKLPFLRNADVKIGNSIEEMLALLAFQGIPTLLYSGSKHWITDFYDDEGFTSELAHKVKSRNLVDILVDCGEKYA